MLHNHLLEELAPLKLNLARLKCVTLFVASLLRQRTVNLALLATENLTGATNESSYRRFQRFFLDCSLNLSFVGRIILAKVPRPEGGWILSMDRTNWKHGKRHLNILTIGIVVNKVAIPVVWKVLPQSTKRGNSNTSQRIALLKDVLRLMNPEDIQVLLMDREFGSKDWLKWLSKQGVGYMARIKANTVVGDRLAHQHRSTRAGKKAHTVQKVFGMELFFATKTITSRGRRDDRLHLVSNRFHGQDGFDLYKLRWGIEQLFSHLKKRGFNLEDTHMTTAKKLEKLFALVTLAFLYSFAWGCHLRVSSKVTKAIERKSLFRQGLESILRLLNNPHLKPKERKEFTEWLTSPFEPSIFVV